MEMSLHLPVALLALLASFQPLPMVPATPKCHNTLPSTYETHGTVDIRAPNQPLPGGSPETVFWTQGRAELGSIGSCAGLTVIGQCHEAQSGPDCPAPTFHTATMRSRTVGGCGGGLTAPQSSGSRGRFCCALSG